MPDKGIDMDRFALRLGVALQQLGCAQRLLACPLSQTLGSRLVQACVARHCAVCLSGNPDPLGARATAAIG